MIEPTIPAFPAPGNLSPIWKQMRTAGYFLGNDDSLGVDKDFRRRFHKKYFTAGVLQRHQDDKPADRERARDVLQYHWTSDDVKITRHDVITLGNENGRKGPAEVARVELVDDGEFISWARGILSLVPRENRQEKGTFGVNLFRTRTDVVSGPHRDHEQFIVVYVVDKVGSGAETTLHDVHNVDRVVERTVLGPGDFVIFDDERYMHSASPLVDPPGGKARRDVLVCTVNYPERYPID